MSCKVTLYVLAAFVIGQVSVPAQATDSATSTEAHRKYDAGDLDGAEILFRTIIRDTPSSSFAPDAQYYLGWIAYKKKSPDAEATWQAVVDNYPTSPEAPKALIGIAAVHYRARMPREARLADYRRVIEQYPASPEAAESRLRTGTLWLVDPPDFAKAIQEFNGLKDSTADAKWRSEAMVNLGRAYLQKYYNEGRKSKEDLQSALETMASVRSKFPDQADAVARAEIRLARYHMEVNKDYPRAKTILEALRTSYPSSACAIEMEYQLAVCARQQGDVDGCIARCRKILEQYPKSDWCDYILYYVANCYATSGRRPEAVETYKKVIELYPAGEWARAARERVETMTGSAPAGGAP